MWIWNPPLPCTTFVVDIIHFSKWAKCTQHVYPQSIRFCEILASTCGPGPLWPLGPYRPGPLIILKNILSWICSRTIFEKHTGSGAYGKHAPGAVGISNMVLEHTCSVPAGLHVHSLLYTFTIINTERKAAHLFGIDQSSGGTASIT